MCARLHPKEHTPDTIPTIQNRKTHQYPNRVSPNPCSCHVVSQKKTLLLQPPLDATAIGEEQLLRREGSSNSPGGFAKYRGKRAV